MNILILPALIPILFVGCEQRSDVVEVDTTWPLQKPPSKILTSGPSDALIKLFQSTTEAASSEGIGTDLTTVIFIRDMSETEQTLDEPKTLHTISLTSATLLNASKEIANFFQCDYVTVDNTLICWEADLFEVSFANEIANQKYDQGDPIRRIPSLRIADSPAANFFDEFSDKAAEILDYFHENPPIAPATFPEDISMSMYGAHMSINYYSEFFSHLFKLITESRKKKNGEA